MNRAARRKQQRQRVKHLDSLKRAPTIYQMMQYVDIKMRRRSPFSWLWRWLNERVG